MRKIASLIASMALVLSLAACQNENASNTSATESPQPTAATASEPAGTANSSAAALSFTPGTYTGTAQGHNGDIVVEVTLSEDKIEQVEVVENSETPDIAAAALEQIPSAIVANQSLAIDAVSGATVISDAILEAAANALESAGVNVAALQVSNVVKSTEVQTLTADIVVVGAGAAGTSAALQASESGAKVIVLEKAAVPGGASKLAGGIFAIDSTDQQKAGVSGTFTLLDILEDWQEYTSYLSDANLFYTVFKDSGQTADWLEENGFDFTFVGNEQAAHADAYGTYHAYADTGKRLEYFNNALQIVEDRGGQIFYETAATELIGDSNQVTGVVAEQADGTTLEISAKSVILATGGAGANAELIKEIHGFELMNITSGTQTGDAIAMTTAVGAAEGKSIAELHGVTIPGYNPGDPEREPLTYLAYYSGSIFLNKNGSRFVSEDISFDTALVANAAYQQGEMFYSIMSSDMINTLESKGPGAYGNVADVNYQVDVPLYPVDQPWTGLTASLEKGVADGVVVKGENLAELAEKIGAEPATVEQTFTQYNQFAKAGKDEMFGKDPLYLVEMQEGPYYAVTTIPASLGQLGGIAVDSNLRVLNTEGEIISNLYLTGNDVASIYNNSYPTVEGITLGFAFNSGRLAAQYAIEANK